LKTKNKLLKRSYCSCYGSYCEVLNWNTKE
jgi:hypothetical protein